MPTASVIRWPGRLEAAVALVAVALALAIGGCGSGAHVANKTTASRPAPPASGAKELGGAAALFSTRYPRAPAADHISAAQVSPGSGRTSQVFRLSFLSHLRLGATGGARTDYRVFLKGPRPRCDEYTLIDQATPGRRVTAQLRPPYVLGWCRGVIHGSVMLESNPYCPPPVPGKTHKCRLFATRFADVGDFSFVTR